MPTHHPYPYRGLEVPASYYHKRFWLTRNYGLQLAKAHRFIANLTDARTGAPYVTPKLKSRYRKQWWEGETGIPYYSHIDIVHIHREFDEGVGFHELKERWYQLSQGYNITMMKMLLHDWPANFDDRYMRPNDPSLREEIERFLREDRLKDRRGNSSRAGLLTDQQVMLASLAYSYAGVTQRDLATRFGVSPGVVSHAISHRVRKVRKRYPPQDWENAVRIARENPDAILKRLPPATQLAAE